MCVCVCVCLSRGTPHRPECCRSSGEDHTNLSGATVLTQASPKQRERERERGIEREKEREMEGEREKEREMEAEGCPTY